MPTIAQAHAGMTWLLASTIGMTRLLVPCEDDKAAIKNQLHKDHHSYGADL